MLDRMWRFGRVSWVFTLILITLITNRSCNLMLYCRILPIDVHGSGISQLSAPRANVYLHSPESGS